MKKIVQCLPLLALSLMLVNCSETSITPVSIEPGEEMLSFKDKDELQAYWNEVKDLSSEELRTFEESRGFMSMQRKADQVMDELSEKSFSSEAELERYIRENSRFIKVEEKNGENTVVRTNEETGSHLIANAEGVFQVEDKVFRLFNEGLVSASAKEMKKLKELTEFSEAKANNLTIEYDYEEIVENDNARAGKNCKDQEVYSFSSDGKNRTTTEIRFKVEYNWFDYRQTLIIQTQVQSHYKVFKNWVPVKRTLTGYFKYSGWYSINKHPLMIGPKIQVSRVAHRPVGIKDYRWLNKRTLTTTTNGLVYYSTDFHNFWGWGDSPSTATGYVACKPTTTCANNSCIAPPGNLCAFRTCPTGYICQNGDCVSAGSDPCQNVTCPSGKVCQNGQCIDDPNPCTAPCPRGMICVGGRCFAE